MRSIFVKFTLAFLAVALISVLSIVLIVRLNTAQQFRQYSKNNSEMRLADALEDYYELFDSWNGIENLRYEDFTPFFRQPSPEEKDPVTITDQNGKIIRAGAGFSYGDELTNSQLRQGIPIYSGELVVGYLLFTQGPFGENSAENSFLRSINQMLLYGGIATAIVALALGIIFSRSFSRPIQELTAATQDIAKGDLGRKVQIRSKDEVGKLAKSFNQMSDELKKSLNARRQMTADIAHELRTPVSLILGHSEGVNDGVIKPNRETFNIIREEAIRLERLVEDLRVMTMADAGELVIEPLPVSINDLVDETIKSYSHIAGKKKISLITRIEPNLPVMELDPGRIKQVLGNLLDNALRYTPEKGTITVSAEKSEKIVTVSVMDDGAGLPEDEIERIFDRLYRTDKSRQRQDGGSGLGLAIARSFIELHGGKIWAEKNVGKGLTITFTLPY